MIRFKLKLTSLLFLSIFCLSLINCKNQNKEVKPVEVTFKKEGELKLYKSMSDSLIVKLDIEIADTDYDVQTGLMYRNAMQDDRGMLFVFPTMRERFFLYEKYQIPFRFDLFGQK